MDTYTIYRQWCLDHHRTPPTREWWDTACARNAVPTPKLDDITFDITTEQREGWAYD